jgi:hypothetical protein
MTEITRALNPLLRWRPGLKDGAELLLIGLALPIYYLVRGQVEERVGEAVQRGADVVTLERSLGIFWEVELQKAALDHGWFVDLNAFICTTFTLIGALPSVGLLAPSAIPLMRNAFLISSAIALVIYPIQRRAIT